jgi:hypothetical protein
MRAYTRRAENTSIILSVVVLLGENEKLGPTIECQCPQHHREYLEANSDVASLKQPQYESEDFEMPKKRTLSVIYHDASSITAIFSTRVPYLRRA